MPRRPSLSSQVLHDGHIRRNDMRTISWPSECGPRICFLPLDFWILASNFCFFIHICPAVFPAFHLLLPSFLSKSTYRNALLYSLLSLFSARTNLAFSVAPISTFSSFAFSNMSGPASCGFDSGNHNLHLHLPHKKSPPSRYYATLELKQNSFHQ